MTSQSVIARPYAEAAFSVAKQDNSIEEWSSDLQKIKAVCADQKITNLLLNPDLSYSCLLYTSPSPRDLSTSRMPSSA